MYKLNLQKFLSEHPSNWRNVLEQKPYCLKIQDKGDLVLFKYNQIDSNFSDPIVQECRGIILDRRDWHVVCHPLHKFFNYGEGHAAEIDWNSAVTMDKIDGSLIKVYNHEGRWHVATNGTIDACDADLMFSPHEDIETFEDLFNWTLGQHLADNGGIDIIDFDDFFENLHPDYTHLYELATPYNRIVVPHERCSLYYITSKHNETGEEDKKFPHIANSIKTYRFNSLEDIVKMAEELPYSEEGYVVVDKHNNRLKVKSPAYLAVHRLKGEQSPSLRRIFDLILSGEEGEFLSYFPEYTEQFNKIKKGWETFLTKANRDIDYMFKNSKWESRKDFAMAAKTTVLPGLMFTLLDERVGHLTTTDYVRNMSQKSKDQIIKEIIKGVTE